MKGRYLIFLLVLLTISFDGVSQNNRKKNTRPTQKAFNEQKEAIKKLRADKADLENENKELKEKLEAQEKESKTKGDTKTSEKSAKNIGQLEEEIDHLKKELSKVQNIVGQQTVEIKEKDKQIKELGDQPEDLSYDGEDLKKQLAELRKQLNNQKKELTAQIEQLQKEKQDLQKQLGTEKSQAFELSQDLRQTKNENENLKGFAEKYRLKIDELAKAHQREVIQNNRIKELSDSNTELKDENYDLAKSVENKEVDIQRLNNRINELNRSLETSRKDLSSSRTQLSTARNEISELSRFTVSDLSKKINETIRITDPEKGSTLANNLLRHIDELPRPIQSEISSDKAKLDNYQNYCRLTLSAKRALDAKYSSARNSSALDGLTRINRGELNDAQNKLIYEQIRLLKGYCSKSSEAYDVLKDAELYYKNFGSADYAIKVINEKYGNYKGYTYLRSQLKNKKENLKFEWKVDKCN